MLYLNNYFCNSLRELMKKLEHRLTHFFLLNIILDSASHLIELALFSSIKHLILCKNE